jgi:hypothetical protein
MDTMMDIDDTPMMDIDTMMDIDDPPVTYSIVRYSRNIFNLITPNLTDELLAQILASHRECFPSIMDDDSLTSSLFLGELCVYMKNNKDYIGHITIQYSKQLSDLVGNNMNMPCNIIWNVCVNYVFRSKGVCNRMIQEAMNRRNEVYALKVYKVNIGAIKCYTNNGFNIFGEDGEFFYMKTDDVPSRVGKRKQALTQRRKYAEGEIKDKNKKNRANTFTTNRFTSQRRVVCGDKLRVMILIISHGNLVSGYLPHERQFVSDIMTNHPVIFGGDITPAFQHISINYPFEVDNSDKSQYVNIDLIAAGCNYSTIRKTIDHNEVYELDKLMDDATMYDFSQGAGPFVDMLNATQTKFFDSCYPGAAPQLTPRIISNVYEGRNITYCDKPFKHSSDWPKKIGTLCAGAGAGMVGQNCAFDLPKSNKRYTFLTDDDFQKSAANRITFIQKFLGQYNAGIYIPDTPIVKFYFTNPLTGNKYVGVVETYDDILLTEIINRVHFQVNTLLGPICKDIPIDYVVTDMSCSYGPLGSGPALGGKKRQNNQTKKLNKKSNKKSSKKLYNKKVKNILKFKDKTNNTSKHRYHKYR